MGNESKKVLVIDDDRDVRALVRAGLESLGIEVFEGKDGVEGLMMAQLQQPDLVLLDVLMPRMDGLTMCRRLRHQSTVPILILSSRDEERDIIEALGIGADGYVTKPFRLAELAARVQATLRRETLSRPASTETVFNIGTIVVNFTSMRATKSGRELALTPTEFRILHHLYENVGRVVSRENLLQQIWGESPEGILTRTVDTHIARLRKKIEPYPDQPQYIQTQPGKGYRLVLEETDEF